jgi:CheY-like chemotaxis protein
VNRPLLIVEDDDLTSESLAEVFSARGFEVARAPNGKEAFDVVRGLGIRPAAIILDVEMPVMGGLDFLRAQGTEPLLAAVPVILISARLPSLTQSSLVFASIAKPYSVEALVATVERACGADR